MSRAQLCTSVYRDRPQDQPHLLAYIKPRPFPPSFHSSTTSSTSSLNIETQHHSSFLPFCRQQHHLPRQNKPSSSHCNNLPHNNFSDLAHLPAIYLLSLLKSPQLFDTTTSLSLRKYSKGSSLLLSRSPCASLTRDAPSASNPFKAVLPQSSCLHEFCLCILHRLSLIHI